MLWCTDKHASETHTHKIFKKPSAIRSGNIHKTYNASQYELNGEQALLLLPEPLLGRPGCAGLAMKRLGASGCSGLTV